MPTANAFVRRRLRKNKIVYSLTAYVLLYNFKGREKNVKKECVVSVQISQRASYKF